MKAKRTVTLIVGLCLCTTLQAAVKHAGATVEEVRAEQLGTGGVFFKVSGGTVTGTNVCTDNTYFFVQDSVDQWQAFMTIALAAQLADRTVTLRGDEVCWTHPDFPSLTYEGIRNMRID